MVLSMEANPVITMTGRNGYFSRMSVRRSRPDMSGSLTSARTTSYLPVRRDRRASLPSATVVHANPSALSISVRAARTPSSSSAISILCECLAPAGIFPFVVHILPTRTSGVN